MIVTVSDLQTQENQYNEWTTETLGLLKCLLCPQKKHSSYPSRGQSCRFRKLKLSKEVVVSGATLTDYLWFPDLCILEYNTLWCPVAQSIYHMLKHKVSSPTYLLAPLFASLKGYFHVLLVSHFCVPHIAAPVDHLVMCPLLYFLGYKDISLS